MIVTNLKSLVDKLRAKIPQYGTEDTPAVVVGFSTNYAIYVHEDLNANHKPGKVAKYLERPARELSVAELPRIVKQALAAGKTLSQALILAGLRVQREAQKIVPIDTGVLRNSAFTKLETGKS